MDPVSENGVLVLLLSCAVLLVSILAVRLTSRTGLPSLLIYLVAGLAIGEAGLGVRFEGYALTADVGLVALAIILAEGGLTTRWSVMRPALPFAIVLATIGVLLSVVVIAAVCFFVLGTDVRTAIILGSVVSSTDAAAVFSVLRKLSLRQQLTAALEAESGLNDAPVLVLVALASSDAWGQTSVLASVGTGTYQLLAGTAIGIAVGAVGSLLLDRVALPSAGLYPLATVALALAAFGIATAGRASGFLGVYFAALVLGNAKLPHRRAVLGFTSSLALLAEAGLFILLGLLASPARLPEAVPAALLIGAVATLLARPLAVAVSAAPFRMPWREQVFLAWTGLRGAVPIVVAIIPITQGLPAAERVLDVVFVLVVVYTAVQAPTLPWVGRRLGLAEVNRPPVEVEVETAPLAQARADLLHVQVPAGSKIHGVYPAELRLPSGALLTLIIRDGRDDDARSTGEPQRRRRDAHRRAGRDASRDGGAAGRGRTVGQARRLASGRNGALMWRRDEDRRRRSTLHRGRARRRPLLSCPAPSASYAGVRDLRRRSAATAASTGRDQCVSTVPCSRYRSGLASPP
jgi:cell volume regulation protein A